MVSRIIWQTSECEYKDLETKYKKASETWKKINPSWQYRYASAVDRAREVEKFDQELYNIYSLFNGMNQADIWRYVVAYKYGGAYADMDSRCTMSLDTLLTLSGNSQVILTPKGFQTEKPLLINNANFYCEKNSDMMKRVISYIKASFMGQDLQKQEEYEPTIHFFFTVAAAHCSDSISYKMDLASIHGGIPDN